MKVLQRCTLEQGSKLNVKFCEVIKNWICDYEFFNENFLTFKDTPLHYYLREAALG